VNSALRGSVRRVARARRINLGKACPRLRDDLGLIKRLMARVVVGPGGCWIWTGYTDSQGYGQISVRGKPMWVHRVTYAIFKQSLREGDEIDHKCSNSSCCNPMHLRRVHPKVNRGQRWPTKKKSSGELPPF